MSGTIAERLDGRHVLAGLIAFFAVVAFANAIFVYFALTTFGGIDTEDAYRRGLAYNATIAEAYQQSALGWQTSLTYDNAKGALRLTIADREGGPVAGLSISGRLSRPATSRQDLTSRALRRACRRQLRDRTRLNAVWQLDRRSRCPVHRQCALSHEGEAMAATEILNVRPHAGAACCTRPQPQLATVLLTVENMHCGACMSKVERALSAADGVGTARADLSAKRVKIAFDPERATTSQLIDVLEGAGFTAAELAEPKADPTKLVDRDLLKRIGVAGFAATNIMLLSVSVWAGLASDMGPGLQALFHWTSALIAMPAIAYAGQPFFQSAARAIRSRRLNMDVPISVAITLATAMSLFQTTRGSSEVYFDAAITLLFFLLIGRFLDNRVRSKAVGAAQNLLALRSTRARVIAADGTTRDEPACALTPGMRVLVAAGERIPADGHLLRQPAELDESLISGETRPRRAAFGDAVYAGTVNLGQPIEIEVSAAEAGTLIAEIARLMEAAEQGRGRYVRLADRAARLYAPLVHLLGLTTFLGWLALGRGWEAGLTAAIAVLIITCPCALALAVPAVQVAAAQRLFRRGVLVKAADGLERLAEVDTIVLDKTGTLTLGRPTLTDLEAYDPELLSRAASLAAASLHPYARALTAAAMHRLCTVKAAPGSRGGARRRTSLRDPRR